MNIIVFKFYNVSIQKRSRMGEWNLSCTKKILVPNTLETYVYVWSQSLGMSPAQWLLLNVRKCQMGREYIMKQNKEEESLNFTIHPGECASE